MRYLLFISLLISFTANSQFGNRNGWFKRNQTPPAVGNTPFSFTEIPYSDVDFINPGRGAEQWHNGSQGIPNPSETSNIQSLDFYQRFQWADLEGSTQGSYTWTAFDGWVRDAINRNQQFSFGIMTVFTGGGKVSYGGGNSCYPLYLHNLMQAEAATSQDWLANGTDWIPNFNSPNYLARLRALHVALNTHILTATVTGTSGPYSGIAVPIRNVIYSIDIRGYGNYGEWHTGGICTWTTFPNGRQPTVTSLMEIIDTHTEVFQDWPLGMMVAAYDGGYTGVPLFAPYAQLGYYALTRTNNWGDVGFRRDQWGDPNPYLDNLMINNNMTYEGSPAFKTFIVNKFKTSPVTGEPNPNSFDMADLETQVIEYGATSFGNGNFGAYPNATIRDRIRAAWKRCGFRLKVTAGEAPTIITRTIQFTIKTNWVNVGIAPTYNNWTVQYELQNTVTSAVVWTGTSSKVLKLFRPDQGTVETSDNLTVPGSVTPGTYKLVVRVADTDDYRPDLKLAITPRNSDGSYTIFSSVTVN